MKLDLKEFIKDIHYLASKKVYLIEDANDIWMEVNEAGLKRHLRKRGLSASNKYGSLSEVEDAITQIQLKNHIDWYGKLAGQLAGVFEDRGKRLLVVQSPEFLDQKEGDWPTISHLLNHMLVTEDSDIQLKTFLGWLSVAVKSLYSLEHSLGQAMVFAGAPKSGKTLTLDKIIVPLLGGRMGKPFNFMSGKTRFNKELFEAEVQVIDDEASSDKRTDRTGLKAQIKQMTATRDHRLEAKGVDAVMVSPFWRLVIAVNNNPEAISVLPLLSDDVADKVIVLAVNDGPVMPIDKDEKLLKIKKIEQELPCFLDYLLKYEIEESMSDDRFGITAYHNPEMSSILLAPETTDRFLYLIRYALNGHTHAFSPTGCFKGTASEIYAQIKKGLQEPLASEFDRICIRNGNNGFSQQLGYCRRRNPNGLVRRIGKTEWSIGRSESNSSANPERLVQLRSA